MAGFGAVVSEVGAAIMVGGNIEGETRVLTTAAVLATSRGQFAPRSRWGWSCCSSSSLSTSS
jgi:ABC-type tungstate transport system substrate-binding protein